MRYLYILILIFLSASFISCKKLSPRTQCHKQCQMETEECFITNTLLFSSLATSSPENSVETENNNSWCQADSINIYNTGGSYTENFSGTIRSSSDLDIFYAHLPGTEPLNIIISQTAGTSKCNAYTRNSSSMSCVYDINNLGTGLWDGSNTIGFNYKGVLSNAPLSVSLDISGDDRVYIRCTDTDISSYTVKIISGKNAEGGFNTGFGTTMSSIVCPSSQSDCDMKCDKNYIY